MTLSNTKTEENYLNLKVSTMKLCFIFESLETLAFKKFNLPTPNCHNKAIHQTTSDGEKHLNIKRWLICYAPSIFKQDLSK